VRILKVIAVLGLALAILSALPLATVAVTHPEKMDILAEVLVKGLEGLRITLEHMLRAFVEYLNWLLEVFERAAS